MAVRAKFDLLFVAAVADDEEEGTGVGGAEAEGETNGAGGTTGSLGSSLSDRWFRFRGNAAGGIEEGSINGSVEYSESDRERDCLSILLVDCFRDERSSMAVGSDGDSVDDDDK